MKKRSKKKNPSNLFSNRNILIALAIVIIAIALYSVGNSKQEDGLGQASPGIFDFFSTALFGADPVIEDPEEPEYDGFNCDPNDGVLNEIKCDSYERPVCLDDGTCGGDLEIDPEEYPDPTDDCYEERGCGEEDEIYKCGGLVSKSRGNYQKDFDAFCRNNFPDKPNCVLTTEIIYSGVFPYRYGTCQKINPYGDDDPRENFVCWGPTGTDFNKQCRDKYPDDESKKICVIYEVADYGIKLGTCQMCGTAADCNPDGLKECNKIEILNEQKLFCSSCNLLDNGRCNINEKCILKTGSTTETQCVSNNWCLSDGQCNNPNPYCRNNEVTSSTPNFQCTADGSCSVNENCPGGFICKDSSCVPPKYFCNQRTSNPINDPERRDLYDLGCPIGYQCDMNMKCIIPLSKIIPCEIGNPSSSCPSGWICDDTNLGDMGNLYPICVFPQPNSCYDNYQCSYKGSCTLQIDGSRICVLP